MDTPALPKVLIETQQNLFPSSTVCEAALLSALACVAFVSLWCYIGSIFLDNYSLVDRLWSITPPLYVIVMLTAASQHLGTSTFTLLANHPKLILMTLLPILWGIRLTYNFYRKGGYNIKGEDYRWEYVRREWFKSEVLFQLLNITFISTFQNVLLFALTYPFYIVLFNIIHNGSSGAIQLTDVVVTILFLLFLALETITDEQQWEFYSQRELFRKHDLNETFFTTQDITDLINGFQTTGMFQYSRHLNFLSEQSLWFTYALFVVSEPYLIWDYNVFKTHEYYLWIHSPITAFAGAVFLILLFQGSTTLTEKISTQKYPKYAKYQDKVSRFIPSILDWHKVGIEAINFCYRRFCYQH